MRMHMLAIGAALVSAGLSCDPWLSSSQPAVAGDDPRMNQSTAQRIKDVPYCPGGERDKGCAFGTNCRVTEDNCQVCQCATLE